MHPSSPSLTPSRSYEELQSLIAYLDNQDRSESLPEVLQTPEPALRQSPVRQTQEQVAAPAAAVVPTYADMPTPISWQNADTSHHYTLESIRARMPSSAAATHSLSTYRSFDEFHSTILHGAEELRKALFEAGFSTSSNVLDSTINFRLKAVNTSYRTLLDLVNIAENPNHPVYIHNGSQEYNRYKILQTLLQFFKNVGLNKKAKEIFVQSDDNPEQIALRLMCESPH